MDLLKHSASLMLVSDLDHTMVDHEDKDNFSLLRFNALWEAYYRNGSILVFSTGRSPILYQQLREEKPLLTPDITIMSVGTEITYGESMVQDEGWFRSLNRNWDREIIVEETRDIVDLTLQNETEQRPHKVSFRVEKRRACIVIQELSEKLKKRGLDVKIIYSGGTDLDILPQGAGKGQALAYLHSKFTMEEMMPLETLVCGDSGNDAELFSVPGVRGVVVNNAKEELLQWYAENAKNDSNIIHASEKCAAGIIEAIGHFNLGPHISPRDVTADISNFDTQNRSASLEAVNFFLFYERWRRAEVEKCDPRLAFSQFHIDPDAVIDRPSGTSLNFLNFIDRMKGLYGDKQFSDFHVWLDHLSLKKISTDTWLVRFNKWELSEGKKQGCNTSCLMSIKDGVATWLHVHTTLLPLDCTDSKDPKPLL